MIAPGLLLIFGLIYAYGKTGQVHGLLDAGTRDAARSATNARTLDEARTDAKNALDEALKGAPGSCQTSARITVDQFVPGQPVTVVGTCTYSLSEAGLPGAPGKLSPTSTFVSYLDPNRGIG